MQEGGDQRHALRLAEDEDVDGLMHGGSPDDWQAGQPEADGEFALHGERGFAVLGRGVVGDHEARLGVQAQA